MPITIDGVVYRNLEDQVAYLTESYNDLSVISTYMPADVSAQNKLASRSYVDQAVTTVAAHYLTSDAEGDNFPTKATLLSGPYYYGVEEHDPDENDYAFVNADEEHDGLPSRYAFINDAWQYQYSLQASGGVVDLTSAQTITGVKTFNNTFNVSNGVANYGLQIVNNGWSSTLTQYGGISLGLTGNSLRTTNNKDLGESSNRWKDLYLSGKIDFGTQYNVSVKIYNDDLIIDRGGVNVFSIGTGSGQTKSWYNFIPAINSGSDLGRAANQWRDLYLSGNIIGSYKEANQVVAGSGGLRTAQFTMDATTVNKIKYLEIYMADGTQLYTHMLPVAAWNMSEWSTARTITTPMMNISVMYSSGVLYVAIPDSADYEVQVFAKMI